MGNAISTWYTRVTGNIVTNRSNGGSAADRLIDFSEGGIDDLRAAGGIGAGVAGIFGTPGAVVGACITALTEVAAAGLDNKAQKKAAAARRLDAAAQQARGQVDEMQAEALRVTDATQTQAQYRTGIAHINRLPVTDVVPENIIYRDLLLAMAQGGGQHVAGSAWNQRNFGEYYRSWDWGNPFSITGRDIADELNDLGEADPSTRAETRINGQANGTWGRDLPDIVPQRGR